jgi:hypothetical protein
LIENVFSSLVIKIAVYVFKTNLVLHKFLIKKIHFMKVCIICDTPNEAKAIEHIVPESMGNTFYVLEKGDVCDPCNNRMI